MKAKALLAPAGGGGVRGSDRKILFLLMGLAVLLVAVVALAVSLGTVTLFGGKASPTPTPGPTLAPSPEPSPTPLYPIEDPFNINRRETDIGRRTYTLYLQQAAGKPPIDMSHVTVKALAGGHYYDVWSFQGDEYVWSGGSDGDSILNGDEEFIMKLDLIMAGVPYGLQGQVKLIFMENGSILQSTNMTAV